MTALKKGKFLLYVACVFIITVQVAARVGRSPGVDGSLADRFAHDPQLHQKVAAFEKGGIERNINSSDYNIEGVIEYAESLLGTRHVMGGYSRSGLDCSGLVKLAHAQFDVELPRSSNEQGRYGTIVSTDEKLKRGDLVFFHSTYSTPRLISHSGIYLGDNKFIHTSTSRGVSISSLFDSGYWQEHYLFATRLDD